MRSREPDEETVLLLRERLRAVDEALGTPPGLWERVRSGPPAVPAPRAEPIVPRRARGLPRRLPGRLPGGRSRGASRRLPSAAPRRVPRLLTGVTAAMVVSLVLLGAWWLAGPPGGTDGSGGDGRGGHPAGPPAVTLTVHNAEEACRPLRTLECALGLAKDPYRRYGSPDNRAGRVWHGDRVSAVCVVADGQLIRDEAGITSRRWYLVSGGGAVVPVDGWLPGVRTRNTTEVRECSAAETAEGRRS
ncbi:hypothetical protein LIX60_18025 [Streptomyces sp. S07_1.15]|uniref:hypothetical protein n=1 Tax=Streptomyces sp. S07_1.15 TaxID=2873925 RepID=UPI001D13A958|nr:hypothetical protein [Streptomyces sp. S07_1.15]MCC3653324.1 hypothetical protein [Streptomyces sp. S07_1.15]